MDADALRLYADENGFISRASMRRALVASLGDNVSDRDVDMVMQRLGTSDSTGEGNSVVSVTEAEAALSSFRRESLPEMAIAVYEASPSPSFHEEYEVRATLVPLSL